MRRLGIEGLDPDSLMAQSDQHMADRESEMLVCLEQLESTAAIIENIGNDRCFADPLPYLSSIVEAQTPGLSSGRAEQDLWDRVQRALSLVRRVSQFHRDGRRAAVQNAL